MRHWEVAEKPDHLHPDLSDRGEPSAFSAVQDIKATYAQTDDRVVVMDDRDGRDALTAVRLTQRSRVRDHM